MVSTLCCFYRRNTYEEIFISNTFSRNSIFCAFHTCFGC